MVDSAAADSAAADSAAADSAAEFARRGFCVVENRRADGRRARAPPPRGRRARSQTPVRREADARTPLNLAADENCVLEALPSGMPDGSAARTSWDAYLARRAADPADRAICKICSSASSPACSAPR